MKEFLKLMLHGLLMIALSLMSLALLVFPIVTMIMEIPNLTGFKAIALFILSVLQFAGGCFFTCVLGTFSVKMSDG